jgi:hypothetical protein
LGIEPHIRAGYGFRAFSKGGFSPAIGDILWAHEKNMDRRRTFAAGQQPI